MTKYTAPPSYVGVDLTGTTALIATIAPGLPADAGGLLPVIPLDGKAVPNDTPNRRQAVLDAGLDYGKQIADTLAARNPHPVAVMIQDPCEHVARSNQSAVAALSAARATVVATALAAGLRAHGIEVQVTDRRTINAALHLSPSAGREDAHSHRMLMYGEKAASSKGRAGQALDMAVLAAHAHDALDAETWAMLSSEPFPEFTEIEPPTKEKKGEAPVAAAPAPVAEEAPAPKPAPAPAPEAPAQPEKKEKAPAAAGGLSPTLARASGLIRKHGLDQAEVSASAEKIKGSLGDVLVAADQHPDAAASAALGAALAVLGDGYRQRVPFVSAALLTAAVGTADERRVLAALGL